MIVEQVYGIVMPTNYGADKAQTEPLPGGAAASLEPDKAVEYDVAIGSGMRHADRQPRARRARARRRGTPTASSSYDGIFEGIVEQIGERLRYQMAIAANLDARLMATTSKPPSSAAGS